MTQRIIITLAICLALTGCAGTPTPPSSLEPPAKALMKAPEALPPIREGDDLVETLGSTRRSYGQETSKLRRLQNYVKTILKKG